MAMYPATYQTRPNAGVAAYRQNQFAYASPQELLLAVYDFGINACVRGDQQGARAAVIELINSLNFDYPEIAIGLLRLYNYCLDLLGRNQVEEARGILNDLRSTWAQALSNMNQRTNA
jgi:flagellar secretion chaperone FliS